MFAELLQLAADKKLIVGMRVHPPGSAGYMVQVWTGPCMGERTEWSERFTAGVPRQEALDHVATIAKHALVRRPTARQASPQAFFQSACSSDVIEARARQGQATSEDFLAEPLVLPGRGDPSANTD